MTAARTPGHDAAFALLARRARPWSTILLASLTVAGVASADTPAKKAPRETFLEACRMAARFSRELQDPAFRPESGVKLLDLSVTAVERLKAKGEVPAEALAECNAILQPVTSIKVDRSYASDSGRFAHGIVTYTNQNDRVLTAALVRCDAIVGLNKVGTQEVAVAGPIPSRTARTLDFQIPLAGKRFHHVECMVTLER